MKQKLLTINLTRRLPDINRETSIPSDLLDFGRCAILRDGSWWVGPVCSSHPRDTLTGYYWGLGENNLFISPRGAALGWESGITEEFVLFLMKRLGIRRKKIDFSIGS